MSDTIQLVDRPIDPSEYLRGFGSDEDGAILTFAGVVRRTEGDQELRAIAYEAYGTMAQAKLEEILEEAHARFGRFRAVVVHRTGEVPVGEASVWTAVAAGHREEAYVVSRFLIDELKARVPIWKRDHLPRG